MSISEWWPLFFTSLVLPLAIAAILVRLRFNHSGHFQSPADFLVVPLTIDLGLCFVPSAFEPLAPYAYEYSFVLFLAAVVTGVVTFVIVLNFEGMLNATDNPADQSEVWDALCLSWAAAVTILFIHSLAFLGIVI